MLLTHCLTNVDKQVIIIIKSQPSLNMPRAYMLEKVHGIGRSQEPEM